MRCRVHAGIACLLVAAAAAAAAQAQTIAPAEETLAQDLQEQVVRIPVTVKNIYSREETRQIPVTVFRPAGAGPYPLVIMNHGRGPAERRSQQGRQRYEHLARYLVGMGFAVLVPTRVGYAETYGEFDPEDTGGCSLMRVEPVSIAASDQVLATLEFARTLPFVDTQRWVAMGQSVGGLTTVAVAWRDPPGLVAAINFAGGAGGDPERMPGQPCLPAQIERLWREKAADVRVPMLWLYWENDKYWGAEQPKRWHKAFTEGGGRAEFHSLPAAGADGHGALLFDMDTWVPLVEAYLARVGFTKSGMITRPRASGFARVDEIDKVPASPANRDNVYRRFLEAKTPRAFAVGRSGAVGWANGDWAMGRALGFCQRRGDSCRLYAVDDEVVWVP